MQDFPHHYRTTASARHDSHVELTSPGLVALDMEGKVLWKHALGPFKAPYNMGVSPVLYKDMVIQSCDHKGDAFIAAFRQSDGSECWRTPRKSSGFGHFGTPMSRVLRRNIAARTRAVPSTVRWR